jgi:hypothetical protein
LQSTYRAQLNGKARLNDASRFLASNGFEDSPAQEKTPPTVNVDSVGSI